MVPVSLAFFAGSLCAFAWPRSASLTLIAAFAAASMLAFVAGRWLVKWRRPWPRAIAMAFAAVSLGCAFELACVRASIAARWPTDRAEERALVSARVDGLPTRSPVGVSFDAWISPLTAAHPLRSHARILWRDAPSPHPEAGETWQLLISLRAPTARVNPASGDGERQLFRDGIDAVATVVATSHLNKRTELRRWSLDRLRSRIARHVRRVVADRDAAALIAALAVGATGEMSAAQWRIFSATGTTHLVAISGSHVTMFALAAMAVARWLWRTLLCGRLVIPRETFAAFAGLVAATAYACLAGLSVPTLRTLLMLAAWQLGAACARSSGSLPPLCAALVAIVVIDPFAALSSGFWLSFVAIVAITVAARAPARTPSRTAQAVRVQAALFVALAPLTLGWYGTLSIAGLLVNIIAIPAIGWVLVPLVLLALALEAVSTQLADVGLSFAGKLCELAWPWMLAAGESAHAQLTLQPPQWWPVLAAVALLAMLCPWPLYFRAALLANLAALAFTGPRIPRASLEVTALDVGDSTAVIVRTTAHVLLYGVGDAYGGDGTTADREIVSLLRARGIGVVDAVILGRSSSRGSAGLTAVLAAVPARAVGLPRGPPLDFSGAARCFGAAQWLWDDVLFESLEAAEGCVLRISAAGRTVLLAAEGTPKEPAGSPNIAILRSANLSDPATDVTILSSRRARVGDRLLSTGSSGAVRLTLGPEPGMVRVTQWRHLRSGPWRTAPVSAPFGL